MGKQNTGRWTERPQAAAVGKPAVPAAPFVLGVVEDREGAVRLLCLACAAGQGITGKTPGREPYEDVYENRYFACGDCGRELSDQLPLRCPACAHTGCFEALVLAWSHVGPTWMTPPHGDLDLAEGWDDLPELRVVCPSCRHDADLEEFWPPREELPALGTGTDDEAAMRGR